MKDEFIFMWGTAPVLPSFWATPLTLKERKDLSFPGKTVFQYFDGEVLTAYMIPSELEEIKHGDSKNYLDSEFYEKYKEKYKKEHSAWWEWVREIETRSFSQVSKAELAQIHKQFTEYQRDAIGYFGTTRPEPLFAPEQRLIMILKKHKGENWPQLFGVLTDSIELDDVQKEQLDFAKLLSHSPTDSDLLAHASKYPWLVFGQFDEQKVIDFLKELAEKAKGTSYSEKLRKTQQEKEKLKQQQTEILNHLEEDKEEATYLSTLLQEQSVRRMDIKSFWIGSYFLTRNFWKALATTLDLEIWDFLKYVFPPEVQQLLNGTYSSGIKKQIEQRKKSYAINYEGGEEIQFFSGQKADQMFRERIKQEQEQVTEIKGQTASLGTYTGKVRKVMPGSLDSLKKDISDFQQGEVLVTTMTQPNMMIIARKAGAIVADEGGITSHAAIIARELKIPCIVGCLHSMKVLNNGDMVEIDGKTGVVKILTKAEK